jgi:peptidoglycan/LPS O-acetylase OafA/YrhL
MLSVCVGIATIALLAIHVIHIRLGVIVILAVCLVLSFARLEGMKSASILKRIAFLGNATYSSYLMHFPIRLGLVTILDALGLSRTVFFNPIALVAYLALVICTSLAVYHLFELPAQNWIRRRGPRPTGSGGRSGGHCA